MPDPDNLDETVRLPRPDAPAFGRYRLIRQIGRGGMGVVWLADDTKLQREVALKFLPDEVVRDREAMAGLAAETRRCLSLTHPNIVRVYDLIEEDGRAAISMEFVDGPSLADRKLDQPQRCFGVATLTPWIEQLCAALEHAHTKAKIVHRDLKPLNLLVNSEGDLKVVDFGIARSLQPDVTRRTAEQKGTSVSLGYASPQQVLGEPAAVADDIYSLGATLYELLTSKPPFFEGDILSQLREVVPPSVAERRSALGLKGGDNIPSFWETTVAACLAKNPDDRPRSAAEVAARLGLSLPGGSRGAGDRGRKRTLTGLLVIAALVITATFFLSRPNPTSRDPAPSNTANPAAPVKAVSVTTPNLPEFAVTVAPPDAGARVWIAREVDRAVPDDGRLTLTSIPVGQHELTVQASGYQTYRSPIEMRTAGASIHVQLEPVFAPVQIVARAGTSVSATDYRGRIRQLGVVPAGGSARFDQVLTVGTYTFRFAHPDYVDIELPATSLIAGSRPVRLAPAQLSRPGELRVFSLPDGAEVLVGGVKAGTTPATLSIPSGKPATVEILLRGYRRETRRLTLKPGETQTLDIGTLRAERGSLALEIAGEEFKLPRAALLLDGVRVPLGKGGRLEGLEIGQRLLEIIHPDYEPWKQQVEISDGKTTAVPVELVRKQAHLTFAVSGPSSFIVTLNGKKTTLRNSLVGVPAGEPLAVEISAPGFKTERRQLTLASREKHRLELALEKLSAPEEGRSWTVADLNLTLLPVAAGSFSMGSDTAEPSERPKTNVTLTKPFWLGRTEVTQHQWVAIMGTNPSRHRGDTLPVENVSWRDATEFCQKLTERERAAERLPTGLAYSLPTEAQWEYACRAGATQDTPTNITSIAWHGQNARDVSHPVGSLPPNPWGFHDMLGNVWEWCADGWVKNLKGGSLTNPKGNPALATHVRRGGSYVIKPEWLRHAMRGTGEPDFRTHNLGFRIAIVATP